MARSSDAPQGPRADAAARLVWASGEHPRASQCDVYCRRVAGWTQDNTLEARGTSGWPRVPPVTASLSVPFGQTWSFLIRKDHYFGLDNGFMASYACMLLLCRVAVSLAVCGTAAVACAHFGLLHNVMPRTSPHSPISSFCTCRETRGFSTILLA